LAWASALLHENMWQLIFEDYWHQFEIKDMVGLEDAIGKLSAVDQIGLLVHIIQLSWPDGVESATRYGVVLDKLVWEMPIPLATDGAALTVRHVLGVATSCRVYDDSDPRILANPFVGKPFTTEHLLAGFMVLQELAEVEATEKA